MKPIRSGVSNDFTENPDPEERENQWSEILVRAGVEASYRPR